MGNFDFVVRAWPQIGDAAARAEGYLRADPRASATYARRAAEMFAAWIYSAENLPRPYDTTFANLTAQRAFRESVGDSICASLRIVRLVGNDAVHKEADLPPGRARESLEHLHRVCLWLHHCYGDPASPLPEPFSDERVPPAPASVVRHARAQLEKLQAEFDDARARLSEAAALGVHAQAEIEFLRAELAQLKAENHSRHLAANLPDPTLATEAQTREQLIDLLLHEAGWPLADARDREWPVTGIPSPSGTGKVDYVLWGDDGLPLAVVEAKRTSHSAHEGREQARLYADALERDFGQRPLLFYTNGYEIWYWDDRRYPPRRVSGFLAKDELVLAIQRRTTRKALNTVDINREIVDRPYQLRAIRAVSAALEQNRRRALLVMATGTGKTRTVIALVDLLQRANWVKRVLFLADRTALVTQAVGAFRTHAPDSAPVNLLTDRDGEARVFVSTYQTVMNLIDAGDGAARRFGPGYFDLIVVDEAHRSIYNRYGEIFDYFDAFVVGLTATPRADIDHNTYRLFDLDDGIPTDAYELTDAIASGYLVPPTARVIDLGFVKRGIRYADLSDEERERWDALEWRDGEIPDAVDAAVVNRWLFNEDTVDRVLEILMTEGHRVQGGDVLGKTIIFAKNQRHAEFIRERFDRHFPEFRGEMAEVITHASGPYAQNLIDAFANPASSPRIAISVDMLDTGIDIPDVVNLVFFKPVHSQTKYWQMVGRGTRLRPDLYGPGLPKTDFIIFDVCGNIEYFNADIPEAGAARTASVSERTFLARLQLLGLLGMRGLADVHRDDDARDLRDALARRLHAAVAGMNRDNFLVRKHLRAVDRFSSAQAWEQFSPTDVDAAAELAGLPTASEIDPDEAAKRLDLLLLQAQVAVAAGEPVPPAIVSRVIALAEALADRRGVPAVAHEAALITAISDPHWWESAGLAGLETVRARLRGLMRLIGTEDQRPIYTDFVDSVGDRRDVVIARVMPGLNRRAFRERVLGFLDRHRDNLALRKLRTGRELTARDLEELEAILVGAGGVDADQLRSEAVDAGGLGRLVRSIVGMERSAAEEALADFVSASGFTHRQHVFIDLIIEQLTIGGLIDPRRLYEDPFTGIAPEGPDALFTDAQVTDLIERLHRIEESAQPRPATG